MIAGRAIKSEYLSIGTLLTTAGIAAVSLSGGSKKEAAPTSHAAPVSAVKEQEKFGSRCVIPSEIGAVVMLMFLFICSEEEEL